MRKSILIVLIQELAIRIDRENFKFRAAFESFYCTCL